MLILLLHESCGCYGNINSQNVAKTYGYRDNTRIFKLN